MPDFFSVTRQNSFNTVIHLHESYMLFHCSFGHFFAIPVQRRTTGEEMTTPSFKVLGVRRPGTDP